MPLTISEEGFKTYRSWSSVRFSLFRPRNGSWSSG